METPAEEIPAAEIPEETARSSALAARQDTPRSALLLYCALSIQALSAFFFSGELWTEVLGLRTTPVPYEYQEVIQILASIGLTAGVVTTYLFLRHSQRRVAALTRQMDVAAGNFQQHLSQLFIEWDLSPSEQSVAVYAMKGFSNAEVANLRGTSASTVKSQLNAVYRKSGFQNRQQLTAFLVEELLEGVAF